LTLIIKRQCHSCHCRLLFFLDNNISNLGTIIKSTHLAFNFN
jgi:hypothetical protein